MIKPRYNINTLKTKTILTELSKQSHKYTLFFLHGLGDVPDSFIDTFNYQINLPKNFKIVLLRAPIKPITKFNNLEFPSWYDRFRDDIKKGSYNYDDVIKTSEMVINEIEKELEIIKDSKNIFLAGFSQGGSIVLDVGLKYKKLLGGVCSMSVFLFEETYIRNKNLPVFISHGNLDQVINFNETMGIYKRILDFDKTELTIMENDGHTINFDVWNKFNKFFLQNVNN